MDRVTEMREMAHRFADDSGATAVVVAVMIVVLLGLGAFAIDAGALYSERRSLQGAADAGALAGVQELPGSPSTAAGAAVTFAGRNVAGLGVTDPTITARVIDGTQVECVVRDPSRPLMLARFINHDTGRAGARAVAAVQSPSSFTKRVMPFGIMSMEPSGTAPFGYPFGASVRLKQPAGDGESGNFQFLSLTDPPGGHVGYNDIGWALENGGVPDPVYINTQYNTKTGVNGKNVSKDLNKWIAGDSHRFDEVCQLQEDGFVDLLDPDCHRLIVCPIIVAPGPPVQYNWDDIKGSKPVLIIGFAYFYIEGVGTQGNDCYVDGRFVRPLGPEDEVGEWGPIDPYGAIGFRLVE